jgi:flagellar motility protein MotE (MotC chaperone)
MRLDERESELEKRDKEFVARQSELKELTDIIRSDRDRGEKKRSSQLEQLSNVYGSMNPPEAAALIEQLDVNIALGLLERMPEKRIGQILALMNPERALSITKMLSGRGAEQK